AAGFAAGVEARIALRTLPMKRQQPKSLDRPGRRRLALLGKPGFKNNFADTQELVSYDRCAGDKCGVRRRDDGVETHGDLVEAVAAGLRHQPRPFARRRSDESEKFSCTPTLRAERPSAMPSN